MGYDMNIGVLKRKTIEKLKKEFPENSFQVLFLDYLWKYLNPDDYYVEIDEEGRYITWSNRNIFKKFFDPNLNNNAAIIIEEPTYNEMLNYLECQLKCKRLYDLVFVSDDEIYEYQEIMKVYKQMLEEKIDWNTEVVVFQHDW